MRRLWLYMARSKEYYDMSFVLFHGHAELACVYY